MNSQINNKNITTNNGETKNHQAFAMELSRLKKANSICDDNGNCEEFNRLGGDNRLSHLHDLVSKEREINYNKKKKGMDGGMENQFQKPKNGTEVSVAMVTKGYDHSSSSPKTELMGKDQLVKPDKNKIISNKEALSEGLLTEISQIKYLIEYMNNNNK